MRENSAWLLKEKRASFVLSIHGKKERPSGVINEAKAWGNKQTVDLISYILLLFYSHQVVSDSSWPHGLQHARLLCPSASPGVHSKSRPLTRWCHPTISSAVIPFSSCLQSFPASVPFPKSQLLTSGGQSIGASTSASVLPKSIQGWFPLRLTGLIALLSKGLSSLL